MKKFILGILTALGIVVIGGFGYKAYSDHAAQVKQEQAIQAKKKAIKEYNQKTSEIQKNIYDELSSNEAVAGYIKLVYDAKKNLVTATPKGDFYDEADDISVYGSDSDYASDWNKFVTGITQMSGNLHTKYKRDFKVVVPDPEEDGSNLVVSKNGKNTYDYTDEN